MTTTVSETPISRGDLGVVTVSARAGRLLFALLLSPGAQQETLAMLANVQRKLLPACIDEVYSAVSLALEIVDQKRPFDPEYAVGAFEEAPTHIGVSEKIITQSYQEPYVQEYLGTPEPTQPDTSRPLAPEDALEVACVAADQAGDNRAQALALVDAWKLFFPEVNKVQELQPRKAKEWVKVAGSASTVFGWLSGVEEKYLLGRQFPLGTMNIIITRKAEEAKNGARQEDKRNMGDEGVSDEWRAYAQKIIEKGETSRVGKNIQGNLQRIARAVKGSTSAP